MIYYHYLLFPSPYIYLLTIHFIKTLIVWLLVFNLGVNRLFSQPVILELQGPLVSLVSVFALRTEAKQGASSLSPGCCRAVEGWPAPKGAGELYKSGPSGPPDPVKVIFKNKAYSYCFLTRNNPGTIRIPSSWCLCFPPLCSLSKQRLCVLIDTITVKLALLDSRWI